MCGGMKGYGRLAIQYFEKPLTLCTLLLNYLLDHFIFLTMIRLFLLYCVGILLLSCTTQSSSYKPTTETPLNLTTHITSSLPQTEGCLIAKNHAQFQFSEDADEALQNSWYLPLSEAAEGEIAEEILYYLNNSGNVNCVIDALESYDQEYFSLSPKAVWVDLNDSGFDDLILVTNRGLWIFNCVSGVYRLSLVHGFEYNFDLQVVKVEDINGDGKVDLFISEYWIGSSCELFFEIFTWNGDQYINLFDPGERLLPANGCPAEYEIADLNGDNYYEIVVMARTSRYDSDSIRSFTRVYELDENGYFRHVYTEYR
jgi:hypothetical protein